MDTETLLRSLGVTGNLKGFAYTAYMIDEVKQDPAAATLITKRLYPMAARHFHVSPHAIEHCLRTVVDTCWKQSDRTTLDEVAGTHLCYKPSNSEFLDMTAAHLRQRTP